MNTQVIAKLRSRFSLMLSGNQPAENTNAIRVLFVLSLCAFVIASVGYMAGGYHWGFSALNKLNPSLNSGILHIITSFGDGIFLLSLILLFANQKPSFLSAVLIASLLGGICSQSLKEAFDAIRPPGILEAENFFLTAKAYTHSSFPSGHTLTAFLAASLCVCFNKNKYWNIVFIGLACSVGLSRVIIGVHWPIDVLVGAGLGCAVGTIAFMITRKWQLTKHWGFSGLTLLILLYAAYTALTKTNDYYFAQPIIYGVAALAIALTIYRYLLKPFIEEISLSDNLSFAFTVFLVAITAYRLFVLCLPHFELFYDEAYYAHWALTPDLGYYSKPPVVAWFIALSSFIFGDTVFGLRFFSPILYAGCAYLIYLSTRLIADSRSAAVAGTVFLCAPVIGFNSEFITTDAPLLFFWALTLFVTLKTLQQRTTAMWIALGLCCGMGMLSKYTMAALPLCIFLFFLSELKYRILLLTRGPWLAAIVAGAIFSLNLYWNSQHQWIAFLHTSEISKQDSSGLNFASLAEFSAAQLFVFGPIWSIALLRIIYLRKEIKLKNKALLKLIFFSIAGILLLISLQALTARAFINWAAPWIIGASILLGLASRVETLFSRKWLLRGMVIQLGICSLFYHWPQLLNHANIELTAKNDPFHRVAGWQELAKELQPLSEDKDYILASDSRDLLAYMGFYAFPGENNFARWNPDGDNVRDHYDLMYNFRKHIDTDEVFLFVAKQALADSVLDQFKESRLIGAFTKNPYPDQSLNIFVYEVSGFKGYAE